MDESISIYRKKTVVLKCRGSLRGNRAALIIIIFIYLFFFIKISEVTVMKQFLTPTGYQQLRKSPLSRSAFSKA